jgi:hypothetical protein
MVCERDRGNTTASQVAHVAGVWRVLFPLAAKLTRMEYRSHPAPDKWPGVDVCLARVVNLLVFQQRADRGRLVGRGFLRFAVGLRVFALILASAIIPRGSQSYRRAASECVRT